MPANFIKLDSLEALDALFQQSSDMPIVLFKHSMTCGISAGVYREVQGVEADVHIVILQTHRPVSDAIASKTGIRHESPQAFVLKDGRPVYYASHYDITADDISASLF
ncbi:MAG: bacillithiol system redox-active protein YtxJ [Pyrinomonadaceae bacterium]|jgi:thioredoxin 1|nr:bacillithiol system redox-active protein YtxJ [Blastocatellia bacterium]MDQ3220711.1 bacillithiol system redox-active protein YtxJ [Acidobacteriota bacterium]MDQ3490816.1 bacillithiol system redox-active protein YtxJ [Acidobacteriota bacterium]